MQASVLGHPTFNRNLLARSISLEGRGEGGLGGGVNNLFESFSVSVSLHSFYILASIYIYIYIYICGCLCLFVSTLNPNG